MTCIIHDEWGKTTPESPARCWVKARCLQTPTQDALDACYADYHCADTAPVTHAVEEITQVQQRSTLTDGLFLGTQPADVSSGVSSWLAAEESAGI